jgi:PIN domain nuclease of toxin-antitoxin system
MGMLRRRGEHVGAARLHHLPEVHHEDAVAHVLDHSMAELSAQTVPMSHEVATEAYALPGSFHRDPADRLLVAAARRSGLTLVTADDRILAYPHVHTQNARR